MKAYIDTNILVDLVLAREKWLADAQQVFALGYSGDVDLVVSALSFVNTVYLGKKYSFSSEEVANKLLLIADFVEVADLRGSNVVGMLNSDWKDYEDATQYSSAIETGADYIITRNKKDFKNSEIPVVTASEFFALFNKD